MTYKSDYCRVRKALRYAPTEKGFKHKGNQMPKLSLEIRADLLKRSRRDLPYSISKKIEWPVPSIGDEFWVSKTYDTCYVVERVVHLPHQNVVEVFFKAPQEEILELLNDEKDDWEDNDPPKDPRTQQKIPYTTK